MLCVLDFGEKSNICFWNPSSLVSEMSFSSDSMELARRHLCTYSSSQWFQSMPAFSRIPEVSGTGGAKAGRHFQ